MLQRTATGLIMSELTTAAISIAQHNLDKRWYLILDYLDGDQYVSSESYATEVEAESAARTWALENHVEEGKPN